MIGIDQLIKEATTRLMALPIGACLDIRSYKRNRKIVIEKTDLGYDVHEDGFHQEVFWDVSPEKLPKLLKTIGKREFPRSNKVRIYVLDSFEDGDGRRKKI